MIKNQNIPVFILAGGLGTRISEETLLKPKPMIEIGDTPILLHIMRWYYSFGFNDFVICAGYRSWEIKNFFLNYRFRLNHLMIDHRKHMNQEPSSIGKNVEQENWRVRVIDTGLETMTGARIAKAFDQVNVLEPISQFAITYGDGLSDVPLAEEVAFHVDHGKIGTVLGVPPLARFGELDVVDNTRVAGFLEKPEERQGLINGGFFFFNAQFRNFLREDPGCILEREPLAQLAKQGELMVYKHKGFWQPMDTLRDKLYLQGIWDGGKAPWIRRKT